MSNHKEVIRRLFAGVWNGENPDVADQLVSSEYLIHDRKIAEELRGPELYRTLASMSREGFPDMSITIEDIIEEGDSVAVRWTMTGTHEGPVFGMNPTGKQVEYKAIEFNRFEDGKLAETWTQADTLSLMEQIDAVPSTGDQSDDSSS